MRIDPEVLKQAGLTQERLKEIFTADPEGLSDGAPVSTPDQKPAFGEEGEQADPASQVATYPKDPRPGQIRKFFEDRIAARLDEGIERSMAAFRVYQAADLAMDGPIISRVQVPLQLLAQGYINVDSCAKEIEALSPELSSELFERDAKGSVIKVNTPKLWEISHNLVHSLVTRRVASVSTPIRQRHPLMKYDSRTGAKTGQLKADLMTQFAEKMSDDYGYRHEVEQIARRVSLYTHHIEFISRPWDVAKAKLRVRKPKTGADGVGGSDYETKEVILKEGLEFVGPHPRQVFWDTEQPLAKINQDLGPSYIGYWDMSRIGSVRTNPDFWNRDQIEYDGGTWDLMTGNRSYFEMYYKQAIAVAYDESRRISLGNDRLANIGKLSQAPDDTPITFAYYFEKLNPKQWGIADYDYDVWIRFIVAGNRTVVWADVCGCTPAIYYGFNEDDSKVLSPSFATAVIPYQDQISNFLSQLLEIQHQGLLRLYSMNVDGMTKEQIEEVENALQAKQYTQARSIILKYSAEAMRNMGVEPARQHAERVKAVEISTSEKTSEIFRSIMNLLSMAERLLFFSPQELGQVAPREISATEANIVNNTTLGIRDFHSIGLEEGFDAKKRIIHEAACAFASDTFELPTLSSYSRATVQAAGFTIVGIDSDGDYQTAKSGRFTLAGTVQDLVHNYSFTSRDGTERVPSQAVAQASVQLLDVIGKYPMLAQAMSVEQGTDLINGVSRTLGLNVVLRVPEGVDPMSPLSGNPQEEFRQFAAGVQEALKAISGAISKQQQDQQTLAASVTKLAEIVASTRKGEVAPGIPRGAPPISTTQPDEVAFAG
jgi:hypothetical protein